jgi:hypothetical protein
LIATVITALISWIGGKVTKDHIIFANFVIMLGFIEHGALIA